MMTALVAVPAIGMIGFGVDYGRALSVQVAIQAASDSAALMLAQSGSSMTAAQLQTAAQNYIAASFYNPMTSNLTVTASQSGTTSKSYTLKTSVVMQTTFMNVLGMSSMPVSANVTVQASSNARNRVALILDNSGSMADAGKMTALQAAAKSFLTSLQAATTTSADAYVSIIPFADDVDVGTANVSASWMDWTDWNNGSFSVSGSCNGGWGWGWGWGWGGGCSSSSSNQSQWGGCVTDRGNSSGPASQAYDTNVLAPTPGNSASLFPADVPGSCPPAVMPLSNDWTALAAKINEMAPTGSTNQNIGLAHGWMSLVGGGPYPTPPVEATGYTYQKTIIILSDGLNTADRWYSYQNSIDARQLITCNNIKAAGIKIYSIQVNTGGDPTSTILQSCASDASKFWQISSASQMQTIFTTISGQLNQLSLTR